MAAATPVKTGKVDIGIITMRQDEFEAVLAKFPPIGHVRKRRIYEISTVPVDGVGEYSIGVVRCLEQGPIVAQGVANDFIRDLKPDWIFLVGIAGAVPSDDFCLGDVVCSSRLHDFCISAWKRDGSVDFDERGGPMHPDVQDLLASLPARRLGEWNSVKEVGLERPAQVVPIDPKDDHYYGDKDWRQQTAEKLQRRFNPDSKNVLPRAITRPTASSGVLMKNVELMQQWTLNARSIANVEMELAGVYEAVQRFPNLRLLCIRGISDIVGFKRAEAWTKYACLTSAAFAYGLIQSGALAIVFKPKRKPVRMSRKDSNDNVEIKSDSDPEKGGVATATGTSEMELIWNREFGGTSDDEVREKIAEIRKILSRRGETIGAIIFVGKREGSVRIMVELDSQDAEILYWLIQQGELEEIGIVSATEPTPSSSAVQIRTIGDKLAGLTLREAVDLAEYLKDTYNIVPTAGGVMVARGGGDAPAEKEEAKFTFDVVLKATGDKKIQVIKVVRAHTGLGLKEAKDLVDGAPKTLKENLTEDEAKKIKKELEEQGATVELK